MPDYFLTQTQQAAEIIAAVGAPNLGLQFNIYHRHRVEGDVANAIAQSFFSACGRATLLVASAGWRRLRGARAISIGRSTRRWRSRWGVDAYTPSQA